MGVNLHLGNPTHRMCMAAAPHLLGGEAEPELLGEPLGLPLLWRLLWLPLLLLYGVGDGVAALDDGELEGEPFWPPLE